MARQREYSKAEEMVNSSTHALGITLGIVGGYILLCRSFASSDGWEVISVIIYLVGMLSSYISSTYYHALPEGVRKEKLRKFDHAAIYLHIAGTYAPFTLVVLRQQGAWGWTLFTLIMLVAFIGAYLSFRGLKSHSYLETVCYVLMGASILVAFKPLTQVLGSIGQIDAFYWLIAGGVSYVIGAIFYSIVKVRFMHSVFHLFVLGGSICHIIAIYKIL